MDRDAMKAGKDRVRKLLLVPLDDLLGFKPTKKVPHWKHVAQMAEMQERLAYLDAAELDILRETLIEGAARDGRWPSGATVIGLAYNLRKPDGGDTERVVNVVRWAARQPHIDPSCLVALYLWLKGTRLVPGDYDWRQIKDAARDDRDWAERVRDRLARGAVLSSGEAARLARLDAAEARVAAILDQTAEVA